MAIDPQLLEQALHIPQDRDVMSTPLVRAVILPDPENAAALVPALEHTGTLAAYNARRILAGFGPTAVAPLLKALRNATADARLEGLEALWSMLVGEESWSVRDALAAGEDDLGFLLDDRQPIPDTLPEYVERDFRGRICDFAYIVTQRLIDSAFDQSAFRGLDDRGRDEAIQRLKRAGLSLRIA